jgi:transglutaminase-like putative cysteine protease
MTEQPGWGQVQRRGDPLTFLRELNGAIYDWFEYVPKSRRVDSPIDHAIEAGKGVCQDFAHVMIALVRHVRIPCRYVSGYVYPREEGRDRCSDGATHAWVEALVPGFGMRCESHFPSQLSVGTFSA